MGLIISSRLRRVPRRGGWGSEEEKERNRERRKILSVHVWEREKSPMYEMKRSLDWAVTQGSLFSQLGLYSPLVVDDFAILIPPFRFLFFSSRL